MKLARLLPCFNKKKKKKRNISMLVLISTEKGRSNRTINDFVKSIIVLLKLYHAHLYTFMFNWLIGFMAYQLVILF